MKIGNIHEMSWYVRLAIFGGIALVLSRAHFVPIAAAIMEVCELRLDRARRRTSTRDWPGKLAQVSHYPRGFSGRLHLQSHES